MKPFAWVLTYMGTPTRAMQEEADARAELERMNRQFKGDRAHRGLVPVFRARQPLGERQIKAVTAKARAGDVIDVRALVRFVEEEHGIGWE